MTVEPFENPTPDELDRFARTLAPRAFNHTWELLDQAERSNEAEEEMLGSAAKYAGRGAFKALA